MKFALVAMLTAAVSVISIGAQEKTDGDPDRLQVIKSQFEELRADVFSAQEKFDERYAGELKKLEDAAQSEANLELVLAVREEARVFRTRGSSQKKPSPHASLARLQEIYDSQNTRIVEERAAKLATLVEGYKKQLADLRTELTKAGKVDEAVEVQKEEKELEASVKAGSDPHESGPDLKAIMEGHRWRRLDKKGKSADFSFQRDGTLTVLKGGSTWTRWRTEGDRFFVKATGPELEFKLTSPRPPYTLEPVSSRASHLRFVVIE